jgi:L-ascorbate metabolism protein UlaG (beta-lactamase superfamily)
MSDTTLPASYGQATGLCECGATSGLAALGGRIEGARLERIQSSPHFNGQRFINNIETPLGISDPGGLVWEYMSGGQEREPAEPHPVFFPQRGELLPGQGEPIRVTWLGHSSVLLEIDGRLILTDPVFGPRAAPVSFMGPRRFHPAPVPVAQLPPLDAVIISHDHYDHLDYPTIKELAARRVPFLTSMGVGAHLERWGVAPSDIVELDWWESVDVAGLHVTATPCRHFSGRGPGAAVATFWSSWAIQGPRHSAWFSGDTGRHDAAFEEIGRRFGGFDLSLIEIGAWNPRWGHAHLGPENAARVHQQVRARTMMPVHWGTFNLATHAWDEPIVSLLGLAERQDIQLLSPMMGQTAHRESGVAEWWRRRRR